MTLDEFEVELGRLEARFAAEVRASERLRDWESSYDRDDWIQVFAEWLQEDFADRLWEGKPYFGDRGEPHESHGEEPDHGEPKA